MCKHTTELCPYCEQESLHPVDDGMVQRCRNCGKYISVCSICEVYEHDSCSSCIFVDKCNELNNRLVKKVGGI